MAVMARPERVRVMVGEILWVKYGGDPFWPALVTEITASSFDVLFIEADTIEADYLSGTVNRSSARWCCLREGLVEGKDGYRTLDLIQDLLAWIQRKHQSAIPERKVN